jgi:hypothetical protein
MYINEIVNLDLQGRFIPAVQLSDFDSKVDNLSLVKSYIFANSSPDTRGQQSRAVGSIDLLKNLRLSFINESANRFVVTANYGHGKSHLALVLANYFGKPYESDEVTEVLKRIEIPLQNNLPEAENFREFKRQYDKFLVVRLRGDVPRTLREQFFPALKQALREQFGAEKFELPFWHQQAIDWLQGKTNDDKANQFLSKFNSDVPTLIQEVEENQHDAYDQYVGLFAFLNQGVRPNAESNYSLREAVIWTIDNFCGDKQPLAGMFVLFDEFSQFIERYSQTYAVGDLQDLLQGIGDRRGKSIFLALSPLDPDEVAERAQNKQDLQNIKRELGRIDKKYSLYSLMESVLSASINTSQNAWDSFLIQNPEVKGPIYGQASELAWDIYSKRYDKELNWTDEKFREIVTMGCFPLHPMTTALLCHLKMQQGLDDDARTILKFVREKVRLKLNEPAVKNGKVNWILPIEIADYFEKRISTDQLYASYDKTIEDLEIEFGDSVKQGQYDVLKALLVQLADGIYRASGDQVTLLAQMTGSDFDSTIRILKELSEHGITRYDPNNNFNSFYSSGINPRALDQKLRDSLSGKKFGVDELYQLNDQIKEIYPGAERIEVSVSWGTSSDWAASTAIVIPETFTVGHLQELFEPYQLSFQGFQEGNRGLVVWLLAADESEIEFFRTKAVSILTDAFGVEAAPPVLLVLPSIPVKSVSEQFLRRQALISLSKDPDAIKEVGQTTFDNEVEKTKKALKKVLGQLFGDEEMFATIHRKPGLMVVPQPFKANLITLVTVNIQNILQKLYELAYPYRPPEFFTDLPGNPKKGAAPLRDAVKIVSKNLLHNRISSALTGMTKVAQERVCKQNLMMKWHILSTTFWIQEPDILSLRHAWNYLEEQVKPDDQEKAVKEFLPKLFNPPFGFDFNTATLLFTACIGKHNNELRFSSKGRMIGLDFIEQLLDQKTPQDFLGKICVDESLYISRRDADKTLLEGRILLEKIQRGEKFSQDEASDGINRLNEIFRSEVCPEDEHYIFDQALSDLKAALESSEQYDQDVLKLLPKISNEPNLPSLIDFQEKVKHFPLPGIVLPSQLPVTEIQFQLTNQIQKVIQKSCQQAKTLNRIESADAVRNQLDEQKAILKREGFLDLAASISEAENELQEQIKKLKANSEEKAKRDQINAMTSKADLNKLIEYQKELKEMELESQELITLQQQRLSEINASIQELETFVDNVIAVYQQVTYTEIETLYEHILKNSDRFDDTKYEEKLDQAIQYLRNLKSFFIALKEIQNLPLSNLEDDSKIEEKIIEVTSLYGDKLSLKHLESLDCKRKEYKDRLQKKFAQTESEIYLLEKQFAELSSSQIKERISEYSPFISSEMSVKLENLRSNLVEKESKERLAKTENVIGEIEYLFLSIEDIEKRKECITRLQKNI